MWNQNSYAKNPYVRSLAVVFALGLTYSLFATDDTAVNQPAAPTPVACELCPSSNALPPNGAAVSYPYPQCPNCSPAMSWQPIPAAPEQASYPQYQPSPYTGQPSPYRALPPATNPVRVANAAVPQAKPIPLQASSHAGLPQGAWSKESVMGKVNLEVDGNKIKFVVDGVGGIAMFKPSLCGEYSVASDGTIYGLIHNVDFHIPAIAADDIDEDFLFLSGMSDIPFTMRAYSEPGVLAIKQVTFGLPMQVLMATDGEFGELTMYASSMVTGQYKPNQK